MTRLANQLRSFGAFVSNKAAFVAMLFAALLFVVVGFRAPQHDARSSEGVMPVSQEIEATPQVERDEVLWLARGIYSETKEPHEQELVAWSVRNRVETAYRGNSSYESVILDPWQYSAFNTNSPKRDHYMGLTEQSQEPGWQEALRIAERVATGPEHERPFRKTTRHFYSERSMVGQKQPDWALNRTPERLDRWVDPERFRFYADVA